MEVTIHSPAGFDRPSPWGVHGYDWSIPIGMKTINKVFRIYITFALFVALLATFAPDGDIHATELFDQPQIFKQTDPNSNPAITSTNSISETTPISALLELTTNIPFTVTDNTTDNVVEANTAAQENVNLDNTYSGLLDGTIVANRTSENIIFFLEGELYRIAPLRSLGLQLPRATALINLFSCDADTPATEPSCFWNPFLINQEGFYEVYNDAAEGFPVRMVLEQAGAPPENQIWIQNRTGVRETVIFNDTLYEIPPSTVQEFDLSTNLAAKFFVRSCIAIGAEEVCEWAPQPLAPGFYYTLSGFSASGGLPNSQIRIAELEPLIAQGGESVEVAFELLCQIQIPVLNVRSGPGLEYVIATKIQGTAEGTATVRVIGRDLAEQWLAVDQNVADGGWITASTQFVQCDGVLGDLPIAEISDGRLAPTPEPIVVVPAAEGATEGGESTAEGAVEGTDEEDPGEPTRGEIPAVPKGQSLVIVTNSFEHPIRFTLSPDEYDLQPGQVASIIVNAGRVAFTASTAWGGGLSGNKDLVIDPDQILELFIYFTPDPSDSDQWDMQYQ